MSAVTVGVDVATAQVRAVAVTADGRVVAAARAALPAPERPRPGWSTQPPVHAGTALAVLAELTAALGSRRVEAVAVTATSGSVCPCDEGGRPIGDVVMYDDRRADGCSFAAPLPDALARIAWLERHAPAPLYLHVSDLVTARLAGRVLPADTSHALKTGADPLTLSWPRDLLDAAGVTAGRLPPLGRPGRIAGGVGGRAAGPAGLRSGTPIVLAMTDGCTGQIAAGAVRPGQAVGILGTTLVLKAVSRHEVADRHGAVYSHHAPDGSWWPGGASNVGAGALSASYAGHDLAALDEAARRHGPALHVRYPLPRTGERFPFRAPGATGFTVGTPRGDTDVFRSVLEGVAFTERLGFSVLEAAGAVTSGPVRAVGGGSRSPAWLRIRASVLDRPMEVPAEPSSGFGAAVLAAAATVHPGVAEAVDRMVAVASTAWPDPAQRAALEESYARFTAELLRRGWLEEPGPHVPREPVPP